MEFAPFGLVAWLFAVGLYGIVTSHNFVHMVMCLAVAQSATYVLLLMVGFRDGATAPIMNNVPPGVDAVDPIVQAMTVTDIVVGVTVTALLLSLALQAHKQTGSLDPRELLPMKG